MTHPINPDFETRCPYTFRPLQDPTATHSEHVDRELPEGWANSMTLCVALAGARASGKSLYVAVLIKLLKQFAEDLGGVVRAADQSTDERYATYYETPFFEEMGLLPSTPPAASSEAYQRDPLIYDLGTWPVGGERRRIFLVIRDVAGEDLENPPADLADLEFFRHAHEVVYLFDPVTVPEIGNLLHGIVSTDSLGADPAEVLENLLRIIGPARPRMAVTLSKFDTLRSLEKRPESEWSAIMGNYGATFNRQLNPPYSGNDPQLLHDEVHSLLQRLDAQRMLNLLRFEQQEGLNIRYFATSSLGKPPHGSHLQRSGIAPFRVLDPLLWLFYDAGVMDGPLR